MSAKTRFTAGAMCGTSIDAIDIALLDSQGGLHSYTQLPLPPEIREDVRRIQRDPALLQTELRNKASRQVGQQAGLAFAQHLRANSDISAGQIDGIGWFGITVFYQPGSRSQKTLLETLGDPEEIAKNTGVPVICEVRQSDIAGGGSGAPLCGAFHWASGMTGEDAAVLNIGGIANITRLDEGNVFAFDTGPGNTLMDYVCQTRLQRPYDQDGAIAASGSIHYALLQHFLADPYFLKPGRKATGVEYFSPGWLRAGLEHTNSAEITGADLLATLAELTAATCAAGIPASVSRMFVCGGGTGNGHLMSRLAHHCGEGVQVASTAAAGYPPQAVESLCAAWYARQFLANIPIDLTSSTGAKSPAVLGRRVEPR